MIPLLGLLGLAVVFVLGSAGIRVVGNAIRKRRSGIHLEITTNALQLAQALERGQRI